MIAYSFLIKRSLLQEGYTLFGLTGTEWARSLSVLVAPKGQDRER